MRPFLARSQRLMRGEGRENLVGVWCLWMWICVLMISWDIRKLCSRQRFQRRELARVYRQCVGDDRFRKCLGDGWFMYVNAKWMNHAQESDHLGNPTEAMVLLHIPVYLFARFSVMFTIFFGMRLFLRCILCVRRICSPRDWDPVCWADWLFIMFFECYLYLVVGPNSVCSEYQVVCTNLQQFVHDDDQFAFFRYAWKSGFKATGRFARCNKIHRWW